ncbi:MAG: hypothetical protein RLZ12_766 [Bacillota bacterium]
MNKGELITGVAARTSYPKKQITEIVEGVFDVITDALAKGDKVTLIGFGGFEVRKRAERQGRNPQTGAAIVIPESLAPVFKAGKMLKEAVNKSK